MADLLQPNPAGKLPATAGPLAGRPRARAKTTAVAWFAHAQLSLDEWGVYGSTISRMSKSTNWWLGDWVRFGQRRYDRRYRDASEISGYDEQTLMNLAYVAGRFSTSRRRETLSWSHHAELARLEPEDQEAWLDRAAAGQLSVRKLRAELRQAERQPDTPNPHPASHRSGDASGWVPIGTPIPCPHCGEKFPLGAPARPDERGSG